MKGDIQPNAATLIVPASSDKIANLTLKFFVDDSVLSTKNEKMNTENNDTSHKTLAYRVRKAQYTPLINGEAAFKAVQEAIEGATTSVDYICWGFQPSMYFKRKGGVGGTSAAPVRLDESQMIGSVIERVAAKNVQVRILSWFNPIPQSYLVTKFKQNSEPNLPGYQYDTDGSVAGIGTAVTYATPQQQAFDNHWHDRLANGKLPKTLQFQTRDYSVIDAARIAAYLNTESSDPESELARGVALTFIPTHHQKMVLIDYEDPVRAVGFVMGHNTLSQYWSDCNHSALRLRPDMGRDGPMPFHDNSAMVRGPILFDLNHNFCQAWDKAAGTKLLASRNAKLPTPDFLPKESRAAIVKGAGTSYEVDAQICRTQAQHGVRNIEVMYLQAVQNAFRYIYLENQYFRFVPLVDAINKHVKAAKGWGAKQSLYLFVVTNSTATTQQDGGYNTWRTVKALGREDTMPTYTRSDDEKTIMKDRDNAINTEMYAADMPHNPASDKRMADLQQRVKDDDEKLAELKNKEITMRQLANLKAVVCTLVCPDQGAYGHTILGARAEQVKATQDDIASREKAQKVSEDLYAKSAGYAEDGGESWKNQLDANAKTIANEKDALDDRWPTPPDKMKPLNPGEIYTPRWQEVYVHSKTTIIDDAFITHGSANLNVRSMEADSELNIAVQDKTAALAMRKRLWEIHTKGRGAMDDEVLAFNTWNALIHDNHEQEKKLFPPHASIIAFFDTQKNLNKND